MKVTIYWKLVCLFTFFSFRVSATFSNFCEIFCSTERFQQQQDFTTEIGNMEFDELNKCLAKLYISVRKTDASYYKKTSLLSIRVTVDQHLKTPKSPKKVSLLYFIFLNNHQCNYTKTIRHLRQREYRQLVTSTSSWWLFTDIHVTFDN